MRSFDRDWRQARPVTLETGYTQNADGSVLACFGRTKVICTAFMDDKVPPFLRNQRKGWVTAEYGMLPGSTNTRIQREAARGKQSGRTVEISRLIGRCLRTCIDFVLLGERTITIDCDVIQADGGTRTTAITGGYVALALCFWKHRALFEANPLIGSVAAISLGIVEDRILVDLDYKEDSAAQVDLNLVMDHENRFVEIQGTAEKKPFNQVELQEILHAGSTAISAIKELQDKALVNAGVDESWLP